MWKAFCCGMMGMLWNQRELVGLYNVVNVNTPELFPFEISDVSFSSIKKQQLALVCKHLHCHPAVVCKISGLSNSPPATTSPAAALPTFAFTRSAQPLWPLCCFPACPAVLLPQGLCTCCSVCLECSSNRQWGRGSLLTSSFESLLQHQPLRENYNWPPLTLSIHFYACIFVCCAHLTSYLVPFVFHQR